MQTSLKLRLLDYISKKNNNIDSAFTLVELIVVIVIIGILSSIAIPSFRNASDKARQKEASTLVSTYVKATQAHATEYGINPADAGQLSEYIQITACSKGVTKDCGTLTPISVSGGTKSWYSPSGSFQIEMNTTSNNTKTTFVANSTGTGKGVTGCYNSATGGSKVVEATAAGKPSTPDC